MKPIVATQGKLAQLRYELSHRVYASTIYPIKAPNGSSIILYGHETGVGIVWRGGRPLKKSTPTPKQPAKPANVNGTNNDAIMIIDSDDDGPAKAAPQQVQIAEFEDDEEELDPDQPYPSVIQQVSLSLNTQVLYIAVPHIPVVSSLRPAEILPPIFNNKLLFSVACADSTIRVITLPLDPPSNAAAAKAQLGANVVKVHGHQSIPRGITMTWTGKGEPSFDEAEEDMEVDGEGDVTATPGRRRRQQQSRSRSRPRESEGFDLLVASHSAELGGLVKIWRFGLAESSIAVAHPVVPYKTLTLRKAASRIAFNTALHPKRRHSQLLITDAAGIARIYDPFAAPSHMRQRSGGSVETGAFVSTFRSTFESPRNAHTPVVLAARKPIIDAAWTSDGRHILALLADGEWGVWDADRSGPSPPADPSAFSLRGFVGTLEKDGSSGGASSPKRGARTSLAPMTPNTRRRKEENLFQGTPSTVVANGGGIAVAASLSASGDVLEDTVIIWYGSEIQKIADLAKFWSRAASASAGTTLAGPGLQLQDISLLGEAITSISQFDTTPQASRKAIPRDLLVSTEHRLIITVSTTQIIGLRAQALPNHVDDERKTDQALLSRGELDLGGMDRLLENMNGSGAVSKTLTLGGPRKVLFASSAA
ncbi:hypothetical protein ACN47E_001466 [Coniothyrium glycines]